MQNREPEGNQTNLYIFKLEKQGYTLLCILKMAKYGLKPLSEIVNSDKSYNFPAVEMCNSLL